MAEIDLGQAFLDAFGYKTQAFDPKPSDVIGVTRGRRKEAGDYGSPYYSQQNGVEVYMPVTLSWVDYGPANGLPSQPSISQAVPMVLELPHAVVSWEGNMTTVETALTERSSNVVELVNMDSYRITIKGLMVNRDNELPEADMKAMETLFVAGVAVTVKCAELDIILNRLGGKCFIKRWRKPEMKGVKHVRAYELELISVVNFNLEEIE